MAKGIAIVIIVIALIIAGYFLFIGENKNTETEKTEDSSGIESVESSEEAETDTTETTGAATHIISITPNGFSPANLEIKQGDRVIFINQDDESHWPASDIHPKHTLYPGSDINKCKTSGRVRIFDSCGGLSKGERYEFVFNEKGSWGYHDHLSAGLKGIITVK